MTKYIKAELLKQKHRMALKLLWLAPAAAIALVLVLMGGHYLVEGGFNWWYTCLLPCMLSMVTAFGVAAEKKHNRHGLFAVADQRKLWLAQLAVNTGFLLAANLIFFVLLWATGAFLGTPIPLWMFVSEKAGSFSAILLSLFFNMGFGIFVAATRLWYLPFSIPARLMCPVIKVLPNGLPVEAGGALDDASVLLPGLTITLLLYAALTIATALWFERREVR